MMSFSSQRKWPDSHPSVWLEKKTKIAAKLTGEQSYSLASPLLLLRLPFFCCCCYDHIVNISFPLHCQTKVNVKEFLLCVHRSYISPFKNRKHDLLRMGMYASSSLIFLLLLFLGARRERIVVMIDTKEHTPHACACVCVLGGRRWGEGKGKTKNSSLSNSAKCLVVRLHYQFLC